MIGNKKAAETSSLFQTAPKFNTHENSTKYFNSQQDIKYPEYFYKLGVKANPIFVSTEQFIVNYFERLHGVCLLLEAGTKYNLDFCLNKEIWVIYNFRADLNYIKKIGYDFLEHGACLIKLICFNNELLGGNTYD